MVPEVDPDYKSSPNSLLSKSYKSKVVEGLMGSGEGYGIAVECTRDSGLELETVGEGV
ncbi:hypothetical protein Tco_0142760, partial [Tanacetum coccineum]